MGLLGGQGGHDVATIGFAHAGVEHAGVHGLWHMAFASQNLGANVYSNLLNYIWRARPVGLVFAVGLCCFTHPHGTGKIKSFQWRIQHQGLVIAWTAPYKLSSVGTQCADARMEEPCRDCSLRLCYKRLAPLVYSMQDVAENPRGSSRPGTAGSHCRGGGPCSRITTRGCAA